VFDKRELKAIENVFEYVVQISGLSDEEFEILEKIKKEINKKL